MARHPVGIRRWKNGWQAYVRVKGRGLIVKQFPLATSVETIKLWRFAQKIGPPRNAPTSGLAHDVDAYLLRVRAMPTYAQCKRHLTRWITLLGPTRDRASIRPGELEAIYQDWLTAGLSAGEVRKRRGVLSAMYTRLDGRGAFNPAQASVPPREDRPMIRGIDPRTAMKILAVMPESKTKARLMVIAWTGLPPSMLKQITPHDLDLTAQTVRVRPRRKGAGVHARTLALLPQAVEAFRLFDRLNAYGAFSADGCNTNFKRAAKKLDQPLTGIRLYDLRHGFATMLYRVTSDLATTARFLLHSSTKMTERYAQGAAAEVDRAAIAKVGVMLSEKVVPG